MPETMNTHKETFYEVEVSAPETGTRLDRWLGSAVPDLSRTRARSLIEQGCVAGPEGAAKDPARRVSTGQRYRIAIPASVPAAPQPQAIPLSIVFEDAHIVVVDKPAGMVVHPAPGSADATLVNALLAHCDTSLSGIGGVRRPGIVHRLDKDTSGLIVVAKTDQAHAALAAQLAARKVVRQYRAVVWDVPMPRVGMVEGNIGRNPRDRKRMAVLRSGGRPARTHYRVLCSYRNAAAEIECRLETGRTHQIRVHMASQGHPLIGDQTYGRVTPARRSAMEGTQQIALGFPRQALHAERLLFNHPADARPLHFVSEIPADIKELMSDLASLRSPSRNHVL